VIKKLRGNARYAGKSIGIGLDWKECFIFKVWAWYQNWDSVGLKWGA